MATESVFRRSTLTAASTIDQDPDTRSTTPTSTRAKEPQRWWRDALVAALLAIAVGAVAFPLLSSRDYPVGADVLGHLFKVWFLTQRLLQDGILTQWMPEWYMGHSVLQYYPPLSVFLMIPINLLTGDILLTHKIFVFTCFWSGAFFAYLIARDWLGRAPGFCAGLIYVFAPYSMIAAFSHGSHPKMLTIALAPAAVYAALCLLMRPGRRTFVGVVLVTSAMVLTHHMQMVIVYVCLGSLTIAYALLANLPVRRLASLGLAVVFGVSLQLWWLVPALTNADLPNVPYMMTAQVWQQSHTLELIDPNRRAQELGLTYLGASLLVFGLLGALARRDHLSWALLCAVGVGLFFASGVKNPLYLHIPLANRLLPERFLIPISLLLALLTTSLAFGSFRKLRLAPFATWSVNVCSVIVGVIVLVGVYADASPYAALVRTTPATDWAAAMTELGQYRQPGRFDYLLRNWGSEASYMPTVLGDKEQVRGWSIEGTPHWATVESMGRALGEGYLPYVLRNLQLWNVRYVMIDADNPTLHSALEQVGFKLSWANPHFNLLRQDVPSAYVMHQDRSIIAIGKGAEIATTLFPWMAQGTSPYIDDYDIDYLSTFDGVLLYGYQQRDENAPERIVRELVHRGKSVFVDMRGATQASLLGVTQWSIDVPDDVTFSAPSGDPTGVDLAALRPFRYQSQPWRPNSYVGLDGSIVEGDIDGQAWPLTGYKDVDGGRVFFIGYDLFNHAKLTRDDQAIALIDAVFEVAHPNRSLAPAAFVVAEQDWRGPSPGFAYQAQHATAVIVSITYSPHWQVRVDGVPLQSYNHENLNLVMLPAGSHRVSFVYRTTSIQRIAAWGSGLVAFLLLGAFVLFWTRMRRLDRTYVGDIVQSLWRYLNSE